MACPFFYPVARLETDPWAVPPRLPLGDAFSGECRVSRDVSQPDEKTMRELCNFGYGRRCCQRFPHVGQTADAVRFHIAGEGSGIIRLQYVFERDCWPGEHGFFEYSQAERSFSKGPDDELLRRQAAAFLESHARRSAG